VQHIPDRDLVSVPSRGAKGRGKAAVFDTMQKVVMFEDAGSSDGTLATRGVS